MEWLVLKNRRHEGPFTESALREALKKGRIGPDDYVISLKEAEAGDLNYKPLKKVLMISETFTPSDSRARLPETDAKTSADSLPPKPKRPPADSKFLNALDSSDFVPVPSKREKLPNFAVVPEMKSEPAKEPKPIIEEAPPPVTYRRGRSAWPMALTAGALLGVALIAMLLKKSSVNVAKFKVTPNKEESVLSPGPSLKTAQAIKPSVENTNRQPSGLRMPVVPEARNVPPMPDNTYIPPPPVPEPYVPPAPAVEAPQQVPTQFAPAPPMPNMNPDSPPIVYNANGEPFYDYNNPNRAVAVDPNYAGDGSGAPPQGAFPQVPTQDTLAQ